MKKILKMKSTDIRWAAIGYAEVTLSVIFGGFIGWILIIHGTAKFFITISKHKLERWFQLTSLAIYFYAFFVWSIFHSTVEMDYDYSFYRLHLLILGIIAILYFVYIQTQLANKK